MHTEFPPAFVRALVVVVSGLALAIAAFAAIFATQVVRSYDDVAGEVTALPPSGRADPVPNDPLPLPTAPATLPDPSEGPEIDRAARARELLTQVAVVPTRPDVPGYERDCGPGQGCVFGTEWSDDTDAPMANNGCDTRNDVLARDLVDVRFSESSLDCDVTGGTFVDPYTGQAMDYAVEGSQIHIDHLFPLAAAWDLGAAAWNPERRATFANDTDLELLAVNGTANLQKGDSTPASWLPPEKSFRCSYVTAYLEVAYAYDLAITAADVRVIEPVLRKSC